MKITVDRDLCSGHGVCALEAPEVFDIGDDNVVVVKIESPDESQRKAVETAAKYCPNGVIQVSD